MLSAVSNDISIYIGSILKINVIGSGFDTEIVTYILVIEYLNGPSNRISFLKVIWKQLRKDVIMIIGLSRQIHYQCKHIGRFVLDKLVLWKFVYLAGKCDVYLLSFVDATGTYTVATCLACRERSRYLSLILCYT